MPRIDGYCTGCFGISPCLRRSPLLAQGPLYYSGCGTSGTCSSGGSVTITQSGTMTAYATRSGYAASNTASKSCTIMPTPVVSASYSDAGDTYSVHVEVTNAGSFPSGTTFSGSWSAFGLSGSLSSNTTGVWTFNTSSILQLKGTVTASYSGASSTGSFSL